MTVEFDFGWGVGGGRLKVGRWKVVGGRGRHWRSAPAREWSRQDEQPGWSSGGEATLVGGVVEDFDSLDAARCANILEARSGPKRIFAP